MIVDEMDDWARSGVFGNLGTQRIKPEGDPVAGARYLRRGQGLTFPLVDDGGKRWYLKKFHNHRALDFAYLSAVAAHVPDLPPFVAGARRVVLSADMITGGAFTPSLASALVGTVLTPHVKGRPWGSFISSLVVNALLSLEDRVAIAISLVGAVGALEAAGAAHRDLSTGNLLVDLDAHKVHVIDFDSFYHPALAYQRNTTIGTSGYVAAFAHDDGRRSWGPCADRYALAVCVAEVLAARPGLQMANDGGLLEQPDGQPPTAASVHAVRGALAQICLEADLLFGRALAARRYDDCPAPAEWVVATADLKLRPTVLVSELEHKGPVSLGRWLAALERDRLCIFHREHGVALELEVTSLGAYTEYRHGNVRTVFADGGAMNRGRIRYDWSGARATSPAFRLAQQAVELGNWFVSFDADAMRVLNRCSGVELIFGRDAAAHQVRTARESEVATR